MSARRYYDDLVVGERRESHAETVELEALLAFARTYDPQYFHADPVAARNSLFGEVIASGIYTMALWRKLDHEISGDIAWICGVAWEDVKWPVPCVPATGCGRGSNASRSARRRRMQRVAWSSFATRC